MKQSEILGYLLLIGGLADLFIAEVPRLINLSGYTGISNPMLNLSEQDAGILGASFDLIIIYSGYYLAFNKKE